MGYVATNDVTTNSFYQWSQNAITNKDVTKAEKCYQLFYQFFYFSFISMVKSKYYLVIQISLFFEIILVIPWQRGKKKVNLYYFYTIVPHFLWNYFALNCGFGTDYLLNTYILMYARMKEVLEPITLVLGYPMLN